MIRRKILQSDLKFTMTLSLWEGLLMTRSSAACKLTETEAFHDLLCRKKIYLYAKVETYTHVSIQSFATAWGWNRTATANFCRGLSNMGVLSITKTSRSSFVELLNIVGLEDYSDAMPSTKGSTTAATTSEAVATIAEGS